MHLLRFTFALLPLLWTLACVRTNGLGGNGEAYNGGSGAELALLAAKGRLLSGISKASLFPEETLCNPLLCENVNSRSCDLLRTLNGAQTAQCRSFLHANLDKILGLYGSGAEPKFVLTPEELKLGDGRVVDAKTTSSPMSEIIFNVNAVNRHTPDELLSLLFHESSHKLGIEISDAAAIGSFPSGQAFLDSVASAFLVLEKSSDALGFFMVGPRYFYANEIHEYCEFPDSSQWGLSGGPNQSSRTLQLNNIPSGSVSRGYCSYRGFFSVESTGYYANAQGHYCSFVTWTDWVLAGGPTNEAEILSYSEIPQSMRFDGICPR